MEVAMDEVLKQGKICEATICYTGDILDPKRDKYTLDYYVKMAKELERRGAHILDVYKRQTLYAPPSGECEAHVLEAADNLGYDTILWSVDTIDWQKPDAATIIERVESKIHGGAIILAHPTACLLYTSRCV